MSVVNAYQSLCSFPHCHRGDSPYAMQKRINPTVRNTAGSTNVNTISFGGEFLSMVSPNASTSPIYNTVATQPCHVHGVQPQPYSLRLNQISLPSLSAIRTQNTTSGQFNDRPNLHRAYSHILENVRMIFGIIRQLVDEPIWKPSLGSPSLLSLVLHLQQPRRQIRHQIRMQTSLSLQSLQ